MIFILLALLQDEEALGSHVEEEVDDAEVGTEAPAVGKDLPVGGGTERGVVGVGVLGVDALAVVVGGTGLTGPVVGGGHEAGMDVDETAAEFDEAEIEIEEEREALLVEGAEGILIVEEEGGAGIGCREGVPVDAAPVAVVADTDILHQALGAIGLLRRHGERQHTVATADETAVAVGLLHVVVPLLHLHLLAVGGKEFGKVMHGGQIG